MLHDVLPALAMHDLKDSLLLYAVVRGNVGLCLAIGGALAYLADLAFSQLGLRQSLTARCLPPLNHCRIRATDVIPSSSARYLAHVGARDAKLLSKNPQGFTVHPSLDDGLHLRGGQFRFPVPFAALARTSSLLLIAPAFDCSALLHLVSDIVIVRSGEKMLGIAAGRRIARVKAVLAWFKRSVSDLIGHAMGCFHSSIDPKRAITHLVAAKRRLPGPALIRAANVDLRPEPFNRCRSILRMHRNSPIQSWGATPSAVTAARGL